MSAVDILGSQPATATKSSSSEPTSVIELADPDTASLIATNLLSWVTPLENEIISDLVQLQPTITTAESMESSVTSLNIPPELAFLLLLTVSTKDTNTASSMSSMITRPTNNRDETLVCAALENVSMNDSQSGNDQFVTVNDLSMHLQQANSYHAHIPVVEPNVSTNGCQTRDDQFVTIDNSGILIP